MTRRDFLRVVGVGAAGLALAACGATPAPPGGAHQGA
ncbi:MAG: twin-arginine translocation signal domain-containing protein [Anaerolineae bacterium]